MPQQLIISLIIQNVKNYMTYFQKHQKVKQDYANNHCQSYFETNNQTAQFRKNNQNEQKHSSKQSYLKAFKKYYIQKILQNKLGNSEVQVRSTHQNFNFHNTRSQNDNPQRSQNKSRVSSMQKSAATACTSKTNSKIPTRKMSRSNIVTLVNNNDNQLEEMLYSSITEAEKEIMAYEDSSDLVRENKLLKNSLAKLKLILKEKLQMALKKNKQELTLMFDQYSNMIKKLLEDKETLTKQLQNQRHKSSQQQNRWRQVEQQYQEQINKMAEEYDTQNSQTKQQIQQFLEMIMQYEEEANAEKVDVEKLKEKIQELQMENQNLINTSNTYGQSHLTSKKSDTREYYQDQLQNYALKIESLLSMLEQLQNQNDELNQFLKSCKCSRIESSRQSNGSLDGTGNIQKVMVKYEKMLIEAEKGYIKEEMMLKQVLRKKDQCIDRLNLVIQQLRKERYSSVDRITQEVLQKNIKH